MPTVGTIANPAMRDRVPDLTRPCECIAVLHAHCSPPDRDGRTAEHERDARLLQRSHRLTRCGRDCLPGIVRSPPIEPGRSTMQDTEQTTVQGQSPVDDATYDLLQALTSKLEAIEAYQMYAQDDGVRDLFERLGRDEMEHAEALLEALRERLANR